MLTRSRLVAALLLAASPAAVAAQEAPADAAAALAELESACARVGEAPWGEPLCGPMVLVDPATRAALANREPAGGGFSPAGERYFTGTLPSHLPLANTAVEWAGERWAMVLLPLPAEAGDRLRLLAHESFHRLQPRLGLEMAERSNPHLEEVEGRSWLRLEVRALARALESAGAASEEALRDALAFRAWRHHRHPGADTLEAALERNEGVAEYAGVRFAAAALDAAEAERRLVARLHRFDERRSFARSFAYATGPALGLLLDRHRAGWVADLLAGATMEALLRDALGARGSPAREEVLARAARYGHARVLAQEDSMASEHRARVTAHRARLLDGPRLLLRQERLMRSFDPGALLALGEDGVVHPTGTFQAEWGTLTVERGGALLSPDLFSTLAIAAPARPVPREGRVEGDGWLLELAPGWRLIPGERAGELVLAGPDRPRP